MSSAPITIFHNSKISHVLFLQLAIVTRMVEQLMRLAMMIQEYANAKLTSLEINVTTALLGLKIFQHAQVMFYEIQNI